MYRVCVQVIFFIIRCYCCISKGTDTRCCYLNSLLPHSANTARNNQTAPMVSNSNKWFSSCVFLFIQQIRCKPEPVIAWFIINNRTKVNRKKVVNFIDKIIFFPCELWSAVQSRLINFDWLLPAVKTAIVTWIGMTAWEKNAISVNSSFVLENFYGHYFLTF